VDHVVDGDARRDRPDHPRHRASCRDRSAEMPTRTATGASENAARIRPSAALRQGHDRAWADINDNPREGNASRHH
jgi:hypothetical protein